MALFLTPDTEECSMAQAAAHRVQIPAVNSWGERLRPRGNKGRRAVGPKFMEAGFIRRAVCA